MRISRTEIAAGVRCAGCWLWDVSVSAAYTCETCGEIDAIYIYIFIYIVSFLCGTLSMVCLNTISGHMIMNIAETSRHLDSLDRWFHHLWRSTCPAWLESSGCIDKRLYSTCIPVLWVYTTVDIYRDGVESSFHHFCSVCRFHEARVWSSDRDVWLGSWLVCLLATWHCPRFFFDMNHIHSYQ